MKIMYIAFDYTVYPFFTLIRFFTYENDYILWKSLQSIAILCSHELIPPVASSLGSILSNFSVCFRLTLNITKYYKGISRWIPTLSKGIRIGGVFHFL